MSAQEITHEHVATLAGADMAGYWWYLVRRQHVTDALAPLKGRPDLSYVDLGCGPGGTMRDVAKVVGARTVLGLDGTQAAVDVARERGLDVRLTDFRHAFELPFVPDAVTCLDVMEHLQDPVLALRHLRAASSPDTRLVVTVPAMPSLHGKWDDMCGHFRRYTRPLLKQHLAEAGWRPQRVRAFFSYVVPPAWLLRKVLKRDQEMEFPPVSPLMNRLLIWTGHVERHLGSPFPFGTSLLAVATPDPAAD